MRPSGRLVAVLVLQVLKRADVEGHLVVAGRLFAPRSEEQMVLIRVVVDEFLSVVYLINESFNFFSQQLYLVLGRAELLHCEAQFLLIFEFFDLVTLFLSIPQILPSMFMVSFPLLQLALEPLLHLDPARRIPPQCIHVNFPLLAHLPEVVQLLVHFIYY